MPSRLLNFYTLRYIVHDLLIWNAYIYCSISTIFHSKTSKTFKCIDMILFACHLSKEAFISPHKICCYSVQNVYTNKHQVLIWSCWVTLMMFPVSCYVWQALKWIAYISTTFHSTMSKTLKYKDMILFACHLSKELFISLHKICCYSVQHVYTNKHRVLIWSCSWVSSMIFPVSDYVWPGLHFPCQYHSVLNFYCINTDQHVMFHIASTLINMWLWNISSTI